MFFYVCDDDLSDQKYDGYKMTDGCEVDKQVPDKVEIRARLLRVKPRSDTVQHAPQSDEPQKWQR